MPLSNRKSNRTLIHAAKAIGMSAALATITACDSGYDNRVSQTATASLGVVTNATVNFYSADGTTLLGSADTGDSGTVTLPLGSYNGPVVVEIVGDADAQYFDEQSGTLQAFPAGNTLRAIAPVGGGQIGVTPLTELAYQAAVAQQRFPLSGNVVRELNDQVRAALAPGLTSILSVPTPFDGNTTAGSLQNDEAGRYALTLAALAGLGQGQGSPALDVLNALVEDAADGEIDSQANGVAITTPYTNFINELSAELTDFATDFGTAELQQQTSSLRPTSTTVSEEDNSGGNNQANGDTEPATIHADLVGEYLLDYEASTTGGPFTDGETVTAIVTTASELQIAGKTLSDPFVRSGNTAEIIWLDASDDIEYALTNNDSGTFNEINVGDASNPQSTSGIPGFLGQLTEQQTTGGGSAPSQIVALAGSYDLDVVAKNGAYRSGYTLNQGVDVVISDAGLITVDNQYSFDPDASDYFFGDESNSFIPRYEVRADDANGDRQKISIFLDGTTPVAWQYLLNAPGSTDSIDLEERPLSAGLQATVNDLVDLSPISLTAVLDDANYSSGYVLCEKITVDLQDETEFDDSNRDTRFGYEITGETGVKADGEIFDQQRGRYIDSNGEKILSFTRNRIAQDDSGFIQLESIDFRGSVKDSATNDPDAIAAAGCATATDPEEGNVGKSRVTGNGFTGDIDGTTYTYLGSTELIVSKSDGGIVRIEGVDPNDITTKWRTFLPDAVGTYDCDDDGTPTVLEHLNQGGQGADSGVGSSAGDCRVKLVQAGPIYEGYFTGNLMQSAGNPLLPVTNGYFIVDTSAGGDDDATLPDGDNVAVVTVDEVTGTQRTGPNNPPTIAKDDVYQLTMSPGFSDNSSSSHGTIWPEESSGSGVFLQIVRVKKRVGSFDCGVGFAFPGMTFNTVYNNNTEDSSCTITVDSITDGVYRGTFTAVLAHSQEDDSFVTISGEYRVTDPDA